MSNWAFQYCTDIDVEGLRESLIALICHCALSRMPVTKAEFYKRIPQLIYGSYALRAGRDVNASLDELHWKYSELTGKYCGCQFWSESAKRLFDTHMNGSSPPLTDARELAEYARELAESLANRGRPKDSRLVHHHVFPPAKLIELVLEPPLDSQDLSETIKRLAVGCVVLESERIRDKQCDSSNPWLRYTGKIKLVENQDWPAPHADLIKAAGL